MISLFNGPMQAQGYAMRQTTTATSSAPVNVAIDPEVLAFRANFDARSPLDELVREAAQRMLQAAIDAEVNDFLAAHADRLDDGGRLRVVRNGCLPAREILTGVGPLEVSQPRVRGESPQPADRVTFSPSVLSPYLRRSPALEVLIPWLYLVRRARRQALQGGLHRRLLQSPADPGG